MEHVKFICFDCKQYSGINGCRAFPYDPLRSVPAEIFKSNSHSEPIAGQTNQIVFEQRKNYKHPLDWED